MILTITFLSSSFIMMTLFLLTLVSSTLFLAPNSMLLLSWNLFYNLSINMKFQMIFDIYSLLFASTVFFISMNVLIFANSYMIHDRHKKRFLLLVSLFILSMTLLIFIPHLIFLLLGWDGLGLVSFLLIIYYQTPNALSSGFITVLTNRIGDVMILLSLMLMFNQMNWFSNQHFSNSTPFIILMIIIAGMTKSAQIPFSSWLPAAMAAPTPVSALVHSSTLVTAGIFLLFRFWPILSQIPSFTKILSIFASLTMIMAGMSAMTEFDMKKIIALSTLSQLGLMMTSLSLGQMNLTFFHLLTHAIFKALLFICAGNLILQFSHSQDLRQFGNILSYLPVTSASMIISKIALCGFPFMAGFYSKDMIIEFSLQSNFNLFITSMMLLGVLLTICYSVRFILFMILTPAMHTPIHLTTNFDTNLNIPMTLMSLYVIPWGSWLNWTLIQPISIPNFMSNFKMITPVMMILGLLLISSINFYPLSKFLNKSSFFFSSSMWCMTPLMSQFLIKIFFKSPNLIYKHMDNGWLEILSSKGTNKIASNISMFYMSWQTKMTSIYLSGVFLILLSMFIY